MLDARIQQLQSDVILDVQQTKVQFVNVPSSGRVSSARGPNSPPQVKADTSKFGQVKGTSKTQPSRWIEKITQEKKKKQQHLKNVKEKPATKSKGSKSHTVLPGTSHKTISSTAKKSAPMTKKNTDRMKVSDKIRAAVSSFATTTPAATAAGTAATSHKVSKGKWKESKIQVPDEEDQRAAELAEVEMLERRLSQQESQWTSASNPEPLQQSSEGSACGDIQFSIRSYLEASVFSGHIERAHSFLLNQHRVLRRRKHLNTDIYNIMMRVWAKKVRKYYFSTMFENWTYVVFAKVFYTS